MNHPYMEVPLAFELFECHQGFLGPRHLEEDGKVYHTYSNTITGAADESDSLVTLRMAFEDYLRQLREHTPTDGQGKPALFWRFRIGTHIAIEQGGTKRNPLVQLRTRLVVPDCPLDFCPQCMRTEGQRHSNGCENVVKGRIFHG